PREAAVKKYFYSSIVPSVTLNGRGVECDRRAGVINVDRLQLAGRIVDTCYTKIFSSIRVGESQCCQFFPCDGYGWCRLTGYDFEAADDVITHLPYIC